MSIEHEHVAIVEEGESESGWEREDETHGGCCIHVLHADFLILTVLERTHQFHWQRYAVSRRSWIKEKEWGRLQSSRSFSLSARQTSAWQGLSGELYFLP